MMSMRQTRRNQERLNGQYNEEIYADLGIDEIAFKFQPPNRELQLFVFLTPTVGQRRKLLALDKEGVSPEYAQETTIQIMKDLVQIPETNVFEEIYESLRISKEREFAELFQKATEAKAKK